MAGCSFTLNAACQINGTSIQQELLCQSRLTCIRVGDNGKGSSFFYFFRILRHVLPPVYYPFSNFYTTFYSSI